MGGPRRSVRRLVALVAGLSALALLATSCEATTPGTAYDFNGDAHADYVWIDGTGAWHRGTADSNVVIGQMGPNDAFVPGDYDGDGRVEVASVDHDGPGNWVTSGAAGTISFPEPPWPDGIPHGYWNFILPVPGHYDGGAKDIPAWYRDIDGTWFIQGHDPIQFGRGPTTPSAEAPPFMPTSPDTFDQDLPVPADYDGDGITDLAVYSPRTGSYRIRSSIDGSISDRTLASTATDVLIIPVPGDYDGVGHAQAAVWSWTSGWVIEGHDEADPFGTFQTMPTGTFQYAFPVPADYDGGGRTVPAVVWDDGTWRVEGSWMTATVPWRGTGENPPVEFTTPRLWNLARLTIVGRCLVSSSGC